LETRFELLDFLWNSWSAQERLRALESPQGNYGKTPLIYAARNGLTKLVEEFIRLGANPKIRDERGLSLLRSAFVLDFEKGIELWELLVSLDASLVDEPAEEEEGITHLAAAVRDNRHDLIEFLATHTKVGKYHYATCTETFHDLVHDTVLQCRLLCDLFLIA
jgi:hypothetical protein